MRPERLNKHIACRNVITLSKQTPNAIDSHQIVWTYCALLKEAKHCHMGYVQCDQVSAPKSGKLQKSNLRQYEWSKFCHKLQKIILLPLLHLL